MGFILGGAMLYGMLISFPIALLLGLLGIWIYTYSDPERRFWIRFIGLFISLTFLSMWLGVMWEVPIESRNDSEDWLLKEYAVKGAVVFGAPGFALFMSSLPLLVRKKLSREKQTSKRKK